ncbi:ATP-binding cassette domain-containing protein [Herbiconiux sp. P18]|uniref:ABC transporter ATP-binding protein n=1 Tax=Herbiconiux liangxiaofengii TaxID=3342795 RepID=UPI0035BB7BC9
MKRPTAAKPAGATTPAATTPTTKAPVKRPATPRKPPVRKPVAKPAVTEATAVDTAAPDTAVVDATGVETGTETSAAAPRSPAKRPAAPRTPSKPRTPSRPSRPAARQAPASVVRDLDPTRISLSISGLTKKFGSTTAVAGIDIDVPQGSFYGIVGPNGAGKTTTLSMATGLLRPDGGTITVFGHDVWRDRAAAKRMIGVLPDRLRLFDRLTGRQLLHYSGTLRGLDSKTVRQRADDLTRAFGLEDAINRLVSDYSVGMTKKIALASSMIHSPRILVLDEPFESVDPVSASNVVEILEKYVAGGGTVVLSSHSMDMIQRVCDRVAIIVEGRVLSKGTVDEVRDGGSLEDRFIELAGGRKSAEGMEWLLSSSD